MGANKTDKTFNNYTASDIRDVLRVLVSAPHKTTLYTAETS